MRRRANATTHARAINKLGIPPSPHDRRMKMTTFTAVEMARSEGVNPKIARRRLRDAAKANALQAVRLSTTRWVFANNADQRNEVLDEIVAI